MEILLELLTGIFTAAVDWSFFGSVRNKKANKHK